MVGSILTNNGAMTALQSLKATQKNLQTTQDRISTGLKVANAKDNAATWAVATAMRSDIATFKQVSENLSVSSGAVATARSGTEQITSLLSEIRTQVTAVQNGVSSAADVQTAIGELINQIKNVVDSSVFKGLNLLNNTSGAQNVLASVTQSGGAATPTYINVANHDLTVTSTGGLKDLNGFTVNGASKFGISGTSTAGGVITVTYNKAGGGTGTVTTAAVAASADAATVATAIATAFAADAYTGAAATKVTATANSDGSITLDPGSSGVTFGGSPFGGAGATGLTFGTAVAVTGNYKDLLARVDAATSVATSAGAAFGSAGKRIDLQKDFMDKLVDTLTSGVGAMVDADMNEEAARLQALQVQQQLGTQALSIANQAPQSILSLFRG